jgi:hypothetical protein
MSVAARRLVPIDVCDTEFASMPPSQTVLIGTRIGSLVRAGGIVE